MASDVVGPQLGSFFVRLNHDQLAFDAARAHQGVSRFQFVHGQGSVNHGFDLALAVPLCQLTHHGCIGLRFALGKVTPEDTHQGCAFEQGQVQGQGGDRAARKANHQVTPTPSDGAKCRLGQLATHGVVNHIRPFALGQDLQGFAQVRGAVVDGGIGPQAGAQSAFFIGGSCSDHLRAHGFGDLNGCSTDTARSTQNQHSLTGLKGCTVHQRVVRSGISHDERGAIDGRKTSGQRHAQFGRCQGVGAKATRTRQASHGLSNLEVRDAFSQGLHKACVFRTRHKGQFGFHLVFVLNDQQVWEIQTGRLDFDQHLTGARCWSGPFFPSEGVHPDRVFT